jgi:hypothetical protein
VWRALVGIAAIFFCSEAHALDMNVALDTKEHLAYVNLWGKIEHGDDQKFRSMLLPYLRSGNLLWKVNLFTGGGDVQAAMGIGDQIRTAKGMTIAPMRMARYVDRNLVPTGEVQCWFFSALGGTVANNWPNQQFARNIGTNTGASWCDCASACFLIWASGLARTGQWVGIHRFRFNELFFAKLPAAEAERLYTDKEKEFTAYLKKLDVPTSILERLYATPSTKMYYLTPSELEIAGSTPYLEELVQARCGSSKARGYWQGNDHIYEEDPKHINCTRSVLKEIMPLGAKEYLGKYGGSN